MAEQENTLEERKKRIVASLHQRKGLLASAALAFVLWIGFFIRTRNLPLLMDATTNTFVPADPDAFAFLRYARYVLEHGSLMVHDTLRYFPNGYNPVSEFSFLSHVIVWFYKFLHFFSPHATLEFADVIYPAVSFVVGGIFFFLLVRRLFDARVALLATSFLAVIPPYLFRTMSGVSDKEALGMTFFFLALYLYTCAFQSQTLKRGLISSFLAGIATALLGLIWGGVQFIFLIIGLFALYLIVFDYLTESHFYSYTTWFFTSLLFMTLIFTTRYTFLSFITSETLLPAALAFLVGFCRLCVLRFNLLNLKSRLHGKLPLGIFTFLFSSSLFFFLYALVKGWNGVAATYRGVTTGLLSPYAASRWGRTVAESHQPYIRDWFSQFGTLYFWLFLIGAVVLVYSAFAIINTYRYSITGAFVLFLVGFLASRKSPNPPLDGQSPLAQFLYFGSFLLLIFSFVLLYVYAHRNKQDVSMDLARVRKEYLFVFAWFLVMIVTSRIAVRILFVLAPLTAVLVAFLFVRAYDFSMTFKHTFAKIAGVMVILYFLLSPSVSASLLSNYNATFNTASRSGTIYHQQWQLAMKWARENTPHDAVFAHWWDYGYYIQTGGGRATLTDGGNNGGPALNYFVGRNVLTGRNATEALEFLKAKGATHLLIISDEIAKYGAFSSIGSNLTYDRFSTIPTFSLDPSQSLEQRNETLLFYRGGAAFDQDFFYDGTLYPAYNSGVGAILVPIRTSGTTFIVNQPQAVITYKGQQKTIPLKCVFVNGQEILFSGQGLNACFQIIPHIQGNSAQMLGAGLYLSDKVWNTLFTHLYLFNQTWEGFSLAYDDGQFIPVAVYNSVVAGPIRVWEISYPESIPHNTFYEMLDLPDPRLAYV